MRIERVDDISEIMKCLPFEQEIRKRGREDRRESDTILFIHTQLANPMFSFLMVYDDDDNVIGYAAGLISLAPGMKFAYLIRLYAKTKEVKESLLEYMSQYAKEFKIDRVQITVRKNIKAMQRYGFKVISVNMERRF